MNHPAFTNSKPAPVASLGTPPPEWTRPLPITPTSAKPSLPAILFEDDPPPIEPAAGNPDALADGTEISILPRDPCSMAILWKSSTDTFDRLARKTRDGCVWLSLGTPDEPECPRWQRAIWNAEDAVIAHVDAPGLAWRANLGGWGSDGAWIPLASSDTIQMPTVLLASRVSPDVTGDSVSPEEPPIETAGPNFSQENQTSTLHGILAGSSDDAQEATRALYHIANHWQTFSTCPDAPIPIPGQPHTSQAFAGLDWLASEELPSSEAHSSPVAIPRRS